MAILLKSPSPSLKSTRAPDLFKNIYGLVLFLAHNPLAFLEIKPAIQACHFCTLDPGTKVYLRFSPRFLQKTPWNLVFLADKPLELVFSLENAF